MLREHRPLIALLLLSVVGCTSHGLSPREVRGQDFSTYVFALYDLAPARTASSARPLQLPARIAVAQIGEVAPPLSVLEALRHERKLFGSVQSVPGMTDLYTTPPNSRMTAADYAARSREATLAHLDRMRRYARDIGADYLFLFGGTIDQATTGTALSVADLTIVGGFLVPSRRVEAVARATGALVDVQSGRVILSVSADADARRLAPGFARKNDEIKQLKALRDEVVAELASELSARVRAELAAGSDAGAARYSRLAAPVERPHFDSGAGGR